MESDPGFRFGARIREVVREASRGAVWKGGVDSAETNETYYDGVVARRKKWLSAGLRAPADTEISTDIYLQISKPTAGTLTNGEQIAGRCERNQWGDSDIFPNVNPLNEPAG
jgi:hypothetical protein